MREDIDVGAAVADLEITFEAVFCFLVLQVLAEMRAELGLDPDGSLTTERMLEILARWDAIALTNEKPGLTARDTNVVREKVGKALKLYGPVLSRLVLTSQAII